MATPHEILGVTKSASPREIRKAYAVAALKFHPDKNPNVTAQFRAATDAYKQLTDPSYDTTGISTPPKPPGPPPGAPQSPPWTRRDRAPDRSPEPSYQDPPRPWQTSDIYEGPPQPWPAQQGGYQAPQPRAGYPSQASYEPPVPRADYGGSPAWRVYPTYPAYPQPSGYGWQNVSPDVLGQMIELLFFEEFGVRWADLPREAQEVLLRAI